MLFIHYFIINTNDLALDPSEMSPTGTTNESVKQNLNKLRYDNIHGDPIDLVVRCSGEPECFYKEFVIESAAFKYERWLSITAAFTVIFLHFGLQHNHTSLLAFFCILLFVSFIVKLNLKVKKGEIYSSIFNSYFSPYNYSQ